LTDADSAARFLTPSLDHLHLPEQMTGLRAAVDRLDAAIERKDPILIYGDYDVDGTMAVIILKTAIELCGGAADFHVPHRIREGYDMRDDVIERAAAAGIRLIISVDMGIRAFAPAETAQRLGVDLIVTDHHLPGPDGVPKALAVVNPNQAGCDYPYKQLCGAGVAFKVAQGLMQRRLPEKDQTSLLLSFMKVVAIATIADAVPLTGENRVFASARSGRIAPCGESWPEGVAGSRADFRQASANSGEVGFRIAPRINAAGRMDIARDVIELFSVKDPVRARELAAKLDHLNTDRQEEERRILRAVEERFTADPASVRRLLHRGRWRRLAPRGDRHYRDAHCRALQPPDRGDLARRRGSLRFRPIDSRLSSARRQSNRAVLFSPATAATRTPAASPCPPPTSLELRTKLDAFARARLTLADFEPILDLDSRTGSGRCDAEIISALQLLEPYGMGNPEPVFAARGVQLTAPPRILKDKHIKLKLKAGERESAQARTLRERDPDHAALSSRRRRNSPQRKGGGCSGTEN
jgi:single-stranded-DNA-specific exonuclease